MLKEIINILKVVSKNILEIIEYFSFKPDFRIRLYFEIKIFDNQVFIGNFIKRNRELLDG
ncbi:hypothetical protein BWK59_08555 [Flavobacterium davisii]|uniref:Uncharacterized protein n=1 Tax=Flavobacterium davisii TaxID=2906077 RepID=A0A246GHX0_9FLAO|nr:hypothetical protein BWK59_08555 [Flavobacterium davisii]